MFIEALAAGIVGAAILWLILQPLLLPSLPAAEILDAPDAEETPRGIALLALHEIDFDRATGKLSDADYADLHARYSARAIALLDAEEKPPANDPLEEMIAARAAVQVGNTVGVRCPVHGASTVAGARFCSKCGARLGK